MTFGNDGCTIKVSFTTHFDRERRVKLMNTNLFEYEMKKAGYRTPKQRAEALGVSLSVYYSRINNECQCTQKEIGRVADLIG